MKPIHPKPSPARRGSLLYAALLAACAQGATAPPPDNAAAPQAAADSWHLREVLAPDGKPDASWLRGADGKAPQLEVGEAGGISVHNLCNHNGSAAQWHADGRLDVERGMSTLMGCARNLMHLEQRIMNLLPTAQRWSLQPAEAGQAPRLALEFADGTRWRLEGEATRQSLYGPPEHLFWEVASTRPRNCPAARPDRPDVLCLRVRDVHFEGGNTTEPARRGAWRVFQGRIVNWRPEPGYSYLLGLHHFPKAPAGERYVLAGRSAMRATRERD